MITDNDLQQIMPRLPQAKRQLYLPFLNKVMEIYEIDTPLRAAAFLAQIAHESVELRYMEEIWGPTPQQRRYEPPSDLARKLGNTQPGDGFRYRGRGPIQITGRSNYTTYGDLLGVDLVINPDLAATPQYAFSTAALFWKRNGLNELADVQDFITITKRINGGLNGLADRQKYYAIAKNVLGADEPGSFDFTTAAIGSSFGSATAIAPSVLPSAALPRGQELIEQDSAPITAASQNKTKPVAKKKSARPAKKPAGKLVSVKKAAKKVTKKAKSKSPKKAAKKVVKKAVKKAAKKPAKKAAKAAVKSKAAKSTKKAAKKSGKATKRAPAKKSRR